MRQITAPVRGMHCAGCVGRVERALREVDGVVEASVNLATERASIRFDPARVEVEALQAAVTRAGYELAAAPPEGAPPGSPADGPERDAEERRLRAKVMRSDLGAVLSALDLSRRTIRVVRENLAWAFGYNAVLIPVAAGLLYPLWGILLSPILAGLAMALSSVSVVANSLRLRRWRPPVSA